MADRKSIDIDGFVHKNPIPNASRIGNILMSGVIFGKDSRTDQIPETLAEQSALVFSHMKDIVEAAGGILVPLTCNVSMIDLAARFALPVLIVAHATLGTINHTRLTIEALQKRSLPIVGVVYNQTTPGAPSLSAKMSPISVERHTGVKTLGSLPYAPHLAHPGDGARAEFAENHLDLTSLLGS